MPSRPALQTMRRLKLRTIGVHALMAPLVLLSASAGAASFNFIYIEASEGNSSGGHTAIQFDDDVYHYQHVDPGLIRLFKQNKTEFHFLYRYLQNRPMHLSRVEVSEDTLDLLKGQFKAQLLTQERQFKLLDDLRQDRILIRHLLQKSAVGHASADADVASTLRLKGVGLFFPGPGRQPQHAVGKFTKQQSLSIQRLRQNIEQRHGPDFLLRRRERIEAQIRTLAPSHWPRINSDLSDENFPAPTYSFADQYTDSLTALFAIKTLVEATPLQSDSLLLTTRQAFKISEAERRLLQALQNALETRLINAFDSNRPDWGYAVLVNLARYLAVEASLQTGYWVFIDDFADNSERINPDQYLRHQAHLQILIGDAKAILNQLRHSVASRQRLSESEYSQFEMSANRYHELLKSEQQRDFRFNGEKALPSKSMELPDSPFPNLTQEQLTAALSTLDGTEQRLFDRLKQSYRYDLIRRNCVTELFRTLNAAMAEPHRAGTSLEKIESLPLKESEKRLGGYVEISYNFIPFVAYQAVRNRYRVTQSHDLDSYRRLELAKLKARQNTLLTDIIESNILSSRLYQLNPDDALFVFFTDDNVPLRPLFGLVNTAAGIGQSIYGLFSWPLDSGKNLKSGAIGILMSLPELVFFNMRKGSYKYLSFNRLTDANLPSN